MPFLPGLQSLRLRSIQSNVPGDFLAMTADSYSSGGGIMNAFKKPPPHSSHPDFANLTLLVFEAVLEVVCVSLPGYIVARMGMFDAEAQKFVANLNTQLFTPCLSTSTTMQPATSANSNQSSRSSPHSSRRKSSSNSASFLSSSSSKPSYPSSPRSSYLDYANSTKEGRTL